MKRNLNPPTRVNIGARAKTAIRPGDRVRIGDGARIRAPRNRARWTRLVHWRAERWAHSVLAICALVFLTKQSAAVKVRVLAATRLEGRADREPGTSNGVVLRGILRDDVGAPVPNSHVTVSMHGEGGLGPALPLPRAERCSFGLAPDAHDPHVAPDEYVVDTDATGSFCIRSRLVLPRGVLRLRFQGSTFFESSTTDVSFDLGRPVASIVFEPEPRVVSLDRPTYVQGVRVAALGSQGDWHVTLRDEQQQVLGAAVTRDGYARIEVRTSDLAGPGAGALSAAVDKGPTSPITDAIITHAIERHARVDLALESPHVEGYPDDGIAVAVRAKSARGDVPTGVVEVTIGDQPVGAARVQAGRAQVVARFGAGRAQTAAAQVRYLPDTPWWEPGDPLSVTMHIRPPSVWRRAPLLALALALAVWMAREPLLARLRMPRRAPKRIRSFDERKELQVVRPRDESGDWAGRVMDAHDGYLLGGATVSIVIPAFPGARDLGVVASTATGEGGTFVLPAMSFHAEARLRVEAPLHATFEGPLPPPAELAIPLVARRRRLLERLVQWSVREWGPNISPDPTPAQVAAHAAAEVMPGDTGKKERAERVKTWARAVEHAAWGRAAVDEDAEQNVMSREPRPRGSYGHDDGRGAPDGAPPSAERPAVGHPNKTGRS
jgi:hypothetical protein